MDVDDVADAVGLGEGEGAVVEPQPVATHGGDRGRHGRGRRDALGHVARGDIVPLVPGTAAGLLVPHDGAGGEDAGGGPVLELGVARAKLDPLGGVAQGRHDQAHAGGRHGRAEAEVGEVALGIDDHLFLGGDDLGGEPGGIEQAPLGDPGDVVPRLGIPDGGEVLVEPGGEAGQRVGIGHEHGGAGAGRVDHFTGQGGGGGEDGAGWN